MKKIAAGLLLTGMWLACAASAQAEVTVNFVKPGEFSDVPRADQDRDRVLADLRQHLTRLGQRLPAGQDLLINVVDVDLAGHLEPRRGATDMLRILRGGADWPRIVLRYSLSEHGTVLRSKEATLADQNYMDGMNPYSDSEPLRYEKKMLDDWFAAEFKLPRR